MADPDDRVVSRLAADLGLPAGEVLDLLRGGTLLEDGSWVLDDARGRSDDYSGSPTPKVEPGG